LKAVREKKQTTYKGKPIKITADFSTETLKERRAWGEIFQALNENRKKQGNQFSHRKKLIHEPEGNEENRNPDPDSNKMKINYAKGPNEAHKNNFKEDILQVLNKNFIEMILDRNNQNVQETLKKF
jgi:hypothetical protein